jgi:transglutaminase-like putative cysteine protease
MRTLLLVLAIGVAVPLAGCPEPIPAAKPAKKPPQADLAAGAAREPGLDVLDVKRPDEPEWFGLYIRGKKAGWSRLRLARETVAGRDVLVGRSESVLEATVGGNHVRRRVTEERVYEARPAGALLSFRAEWSGDGGDRSVTGRCAARRCEAVLANGGDGSTVTRVLEDVDETADQADSVRLAAARRGTLEGESLDLEKLRIRNVRTAFVRRETIAGAGVETEVSLVTESEAEDRIPYEYRVADDGRVVEIRFGEAIVARPEAEEIARRLDRVDLFALARVALPGPLPTGVVPGRIRYALRGLPPAFQKADGRQTFAKGPNGTTLLTVTARIPRAADPSRDSPRTRPAMAREELASTPQIDADHAGIAALAREVAGGVPGAYAASVKLADHVYRRLQKAYGASADRASEVLAAGKGDCTEHSILFVALARALGIPARTVHGLVYARYDDGVPALYWHAWAEVQSANEWIAIDPTFGQAVADATHLALGGGTQVDTVGLLGALTVVSAELEAPAASARKP